MGWPVGARCDWIFGVNHHGNLCDCVLFDQIINNNDGKRLMEKRLLINYIGIDIFVDDAGKFSACAGNVEYKDKTLSGLKRKLSKHAWYAADALVVQYPLLESNIKRRVVMPAANGRFKSAETGNLISSDVELYYYDEEIGKEICQINDEITSLRNRLTAIIAKLKPVKNVFNYKLVGFTEEEEEEELIEEDDE